MSRQCEPTYSVEVPVRTLIAAIDRTIEREKISHDARTEKYYRDLERWRKVVVAKLRKLADTVEAGGDYPRSSYNDPTLPSRPHKPELNVVQAKKDLALLKASMVPTIKIKAADYLGRYL